MMCGKIICNTIPYTPQQNGVAERKNRSLKEMATRMMEANTFPPKFSTKAIKCTSYIQNRVPHNHVYGMICWSRTLMVLKVGNSVGLWEFVSRVTTQNSLRGVRVESESSVCNKPMV